MPHDDVQEVAVQADHDDDEALQPHADQNHAGDQEQQTGLVRSFGIHSTCGITMLQTSSM